MTRWIIGALAAFMLTGMGAAMAGTTTRADVQGTIMTVYKPSALPEFVRITLKKGYGALQSAELVRRMQLAVEGLTGCEFEPTSMKKHRKVVEVGFGKGCWFHGYYDSPRAATVVSARTIPSYD